MIQRHFFVCTAERPPYGKPSCGPRGGRDVVERLRAVLEARPELADEVAIAETSCLGPCFDGPTVVVYPEGMWYLGVGLEQASEIAEHHLVGGQAVERLCRSAREPS